MQKVWAALGNLGIVFFLLQNMDTLEKNLRQFFPRCLKICGQFGDWILPDHFRQIFEVGKFSILPKILHSGKILMLEKKSGTFGNFILLNTFR